MASPRSSPRQSRSQRPAGAIWLRTATAAVVVVVTACLFATPAVATRITVTRGRPGSVGYSMWRRLVTARRVNSVTTASAGPALVPSCVRTTCCVSICRSSRRVATWMSFGGVSSGTSITASPSCPLSIGTLNAALPGDGFQGQSFSFVTQGQVDALPSCDIPGLKWWVGRYVYVKRGSHGGGKALSSKPKAPSAPAAALGRYARCVLRCLPRLAGKAPAWPACVEAQVRRRVAHSVCVDKCGGRSLV